MDISVKGWQEEKSREGSSGRWSNKGKVVGIWKGMETYDKYFDMTGAYGTYGIAVAEKAIKACSSQPCLKEDQETLMLRKPGAVRWWWQEFQELESGLEAKCITQFIQFFSSLNKFLPTSWDIPGTMVGRVYSKQSPWSPAFIEFTF